MDELSRLDESLRSTGSTMATHKGFPNAAAERGRAPLSLDRLLISHPVSTYFFRVRGHSWYRLGVFDGDIAVIDRSLTPHEGSLIIDWDETGSFQLRQWSPAIHHSWGVITSIIHPFTK